MNKKNIDLCNLIKEIMAKILQKESAEMSLLDVDTDFFEIGFDSINAIELVVELEKELDFEIPYEELIYDNINTINKLINVISKGNINI